MPIRAIMFDLDGTLIDQFEAIHRAFSRVLVSMNFPKPSYEKVKRAVGGASDTTMAKLVGPENSAEAVKRLRPIFEEEMLTGLHALPGAESVLKLCHKHEITAAVLTNKHGPHARTVCDYLKLSQFLTFIIGANDTEWKKPDPMLTNFALSRLGFHASETLYVGDSPYDFKTAELGGMECALIATGTHSKGELKDLGCPTVSDDINEFIETRFSTIIHS
ncbi:MAG: HAD family hydrolase [Opitutales bacterium]|nr:HAD family hydrolase [Opitutales bacterium]